MTQNYQLPTTVTPPIYSGLGNTFSYNSQAQYNTRSDITTYGAIILPFDLEKVEKENRLKTDAKVVTNFRGKLRSALNLSSNQNLFIGAMKSPLQTFKTLSEYMLDNRNEISGLMNTIGSKFSGIAVAQAIIDGKVTSKEALDYLFMGFAPALGVQGSLMGYSGLNQIKDALSSGSIDVGAFVSGFARTLKGAVDLKDYIKKKTVEVGANVLEFDLTISHSENYQSETPDRRVQSGQSLQEYIHNLPETIEVQCALQEGKRYSKAEFRSILQYLRLKKETVQLVLGDEIFDSLVLTSFNPSHDCTKSGMDYTLSFKRVYRSDIEANTEVNIIQIDRKKLEAQISNSGSTSGSSVGNIGGTVGNVDTSAIIKQVDVDVRAVTISPTKTSVYKKAVEGNI